MQYLLEPLSLFRQHRELIIFIIEIDFRSTKLQVVNLGNLLRWIKFFVLK